MVFLEEYKGFLAKQKAAAESQLVATVEDHGHQLFKMLDTNADDRLSLREIYYAQQCLQAADQDGDGALALSEVPHNYQLKLGMGQQSMGGVFAVAITNGMQQEKPKSSVGPEWFSRMDKNGDGDISRREFLGSAEDFQRIDADNDELIDPKEAEAAVANNK
jgi:Ca2+-binding EF-hand superfamily protein